MISLPLIWIAFPLITGVLLIPFAKNRRLSVSVVSIISLLLTILAIVLPKEMAFVIFGHRYEFNPVFFLLGRMLSINHNAAVIIALLYLVNFSWNLISTRFKVSQYFGSLSLITTALWVTVLAIEPFLYAAVIVAIITLISIPLLSPRGEANRPGLFRYLILQLLATSLILLSGWMLAGIVSAPSASPLIFRATVMVLLGFILWLGVFPLNSWLSMLSDESHHWVVGMLLSMRQIALIIYFLHFLDRFAWLRNLPNIFKDMQLIGLVIIAFGGIAAASQKSIRRLFGFFFLIETGYTLLSIGLAAHGGLNQVAMSFIPRLISYWLWAFTVASLSDQGNLKLGYLNELSGLFYRAPFLASGLFFSLLNLLGVPLFAFFPVRRLVWAGVAGSQTSWLIFLVIGIASMIVHALNLLRIFIQPESETRPATPEAPSQKFFIGLGILLLIVVGIFPHFFLPYWTGILAPFTNLFNAFP
ncbi:MAG: hypothetical protein GXY37_02005 [Chloroflexi bacterium]|nr:hypothetical protein [Chloroflexota bacterium]